jgi:hypothetical protein
MTILRAPRKSKDEKLAKLTSQQRGDLDRIELDAIARYTGDLTQLESALGMLRMGYHFGWKVLYIVHSKRTIRKYEEVLGIKVRELFPAEGPSSYRNNGYRLIEAASNFWKVISGDSQERKLDEKRRNIDA